MGPRSRFVSWISSLPRNWPWPATASRWQSEPNVSSDSTRLNAGRRRPEWSSSQTRRYPTTLWSEKSRGKNYHGCGSRAGCRPLYTAGNILRRVEKRPCPGTAASVYAAVAVSGLLVNQCHTIANYFAAAPCSSVAAERQATLLSRILVATRLSRRISAQSRCVCL